MRDMAQVVSFAQQQGLPVQPAQQHQPQISAADAMFVNELFEQLKAAFPAWGLSFRNGAELDTAKRLWTTELVRAGVTGAEQIHRGLQAAIASASPHFPSVGQFVEWCQGDTFEDAFERMLKRQPCENQAEVRTRERVGFACRTQLPEAQARSLFAKTLKEFKQRQQRGDFPATVMPGLPVRSAVPEITQAISRRAPGTTAIEKRMAAIRKGASHAE